MGKVKVMSGSGGSGGSIEINTAAKMDALLTASNVGKYYRYVGDTTSSYKKNDFYEVIGLTYYNFYDENGCKLTTQTVAGLANAVYYTKGYDDTIRKRIGGRIFYINPNAVEGTDDKFYVYDTAGLTSGLYWGYYYTVIGATSNDIGGGKINTQLVLASGVPTDYTPNIWSFIKDKKDNSYNGCNDWFIGNNIEQDQLRESNLVNWYSTSSIWSSKENRYDDASYFYYWENMWYLGNKNITFNAFAMRSF